MRKVIKRITYGSLLVVTVMFMRLTVAQVFLNKPALSEMRFQLAAAADYGYSDMQPPRDPNQPYYPEHSPNELSANNGQEGVAPPSGDTAPGDVSDVDGNLRVVPRGSNPPGNAPNQIINPPPRANSPLPKGEAMSNESMRANDASSLKPR